MLCIFWWLFHQVTATLHMTAKFGGRDTKPTTKHMMAAQEYNEIFTQAPDVQFKVQIVLKVFDGLRCISSDCFWGFLILIFDITAVILTNLLTWTFFKRRTWTSYILYWLMTTIKTLWPGASFQNRANWDSVLCFVISEHTVSSSQLILCQLARWRRYDHLWPQKR
jgi:hypothetical protein